MIVTNHADGQVTLTKYLGRESGTQSKQEICNSSGNWLDNKIISHVKNP
jgi:hypothetical protein